MKSKSNSRSDSSDGENDANHKVLEVPGDAAGLRQAIATLRNQQETLATRREAMQAIQAASFGNLEYDAVRSDYIAALREVSRDQELELRQSALGLLAREHDGFAQKALLDGLQTPDKALVPPEKALQLLGYDAHAAAYPLARQLLKSASSESVRREALRLLAGDPESAPLLQHVLDNKTEVPGIRRLAAAALHTLNPDKLQNWASKAVLDKSEHEDIVATCLTALHQFGDPKAIASNSPLQKRVAQLQTKAPAKVRTLARQFGEKYGI